MKYKKHIQVYEEYSSENLYDEISSSDFYDDTRGVDSVHPYKSNPEEFKKLTNRIGIAIGKETEVLSTKFTPNYNSMEINTNQYSFLIYPRIDEYYLVKICIFNASRLGCKTKYFKCDSIEGLLQFIKDILQ
jgi:hypothetical protein